MITLDPSASPHDVPLDAGDDAFLFALAGSLDDVRLGAVLSVAAAAADARHAEPDLSDDGRVARVLRDAFDRCFEMAAPALHLTPVTAPDGARRRVRWEVGAAWALEQTADATSAAARGHALRRMLAMRATREPLRERAERLMDRLGAAVGYHGDRLTAERLDAFEAALVAVEQAAAALVSGAAEGTRGAGGRP